MGQSIFIDFLQVAVSVINVNVIRDLPDLIAQGFDIFHGLTFLCSLHSLRSNYLNYPTTKNLSNHKERIGHKVRNVPEFYATFAFSAVKFLFIRNFEPLRSLLS